MQADSGIFWHVCVNELWHTGGVEKGVHNSAMAAEIRAERAVQGWTQRQLAEKSGINYHTLLNVLDGSRDINVTQIIQLAGAFGIPASEFVERALARAERMSAGQTNGD